MRKEKVKKWLFFIYIAAILLLCALIIPIIKSVSSEQEILELEHAVESFGAFGVLILILIQILQIIVAVIPGEVVEFVSGAMYGAFGGLLIDLIGIAIGETVVYYTVKFLGESVVEKIAGNKKIQQLKVLKDEKKRDLIMFLLFFIPGTPKDAICYVAPLFKIPFKSFIIISTFARIPSVLTSTYAGAAFGEGNFIKTVLMYVIIAVISVAGILINQKIVKGKENGKD